MNQDTILKRANSVTFELVAGEAILIDMNSGSYFSLDEVGTVFWEKLDGGRTLGDLAQQIANNYNEKAGRYVTELGKLTQAASPNQIESLALAFGMEEDEVKEHWQRLGAGTAAAAAQSLVAEFRVEQAQVLNDLYDLAATMQAEKLLVVVE